MTESNETDRDTIITDLKRLIASCSDPNTRRVYQQMLNSAEKVSAQSHEDKR